MTGKITNDRKRRKEIVNMYRKRVNESGGVTVNYNHFFMMVLEKLFKQLLAGYSL